MRLTTKIKSRHHELNAAAFEIFGRDESYLQIADVRPDEFLIAVKSNDEELDAVFFARANEIAREARSTKHGIRSFIIILPELPCYALYIAMRSQ